MIVQLKLTNLTEKEIIYQGVAKMETIPNGRKFQFGDGIYQYTWQVYDKGMTLHSHSQVDVHLTFKEQAKTKGHIQSEFGRLDVQCLTHIYRPGYNRVELEYDLLMDQSEQHFHFVLEIEQESLHEIH